MHRMHTTANKTPKGNNEHQIALHFRDSPLHFLQQPSALNLKGYKGTSAQRPFHLRAFTLLWRLLMSCAPLPRFIMRKVYHI